MYIQEVDTYVTRRQNTVAKLSVTSPIVDLCLAVAQRPGARVPKHWWEEEVLDLEGIRTLDRTADLKLK